MSVGGLVLQFPLLLIHRAKFPSSQKIEHPTFINYVCIQLEILTRIEAVQFNLILEHHYSLSWCEEMIVRLAG